MSNPVHFPSRHNRGGFTLIEVMVALSLLGVGMFVLLTAHWNAAIAFTDIREATELKLLTDQAISAAEMRALAGEKQGDGDFGEAFEDFEYRFKSSEVDTAEAKGLMKVEVTVQRPDEEDHTLEFMVYDGTQEITEQP